MATVKFIIGITTGRSGSMSLAHFLNKQPDIKFSHEGLKLPFWPIFDLYPQALKTLREGLKDSPIVGDISPMWVNYLDRFVRDVGRDNVKIIWLDRGSPGQVVTSFDSYKRYEKHSPRGAFGMYPILERKYSRDALRRTVDLMEWLISCCEMQFGDIMAKWEMKDLNDKDAQKNLLHWLGIPTERHVYGMERTNIRHDLVKKFRKNKNEGRDRGVFEVGGYDIGGEDDPYK